MTEQVEQRIFIKFCVKLEHSSTEIIQMIQKTTATGNWWLAASSQQHMCSCITSGTVFGTTSNHPDDSGPLQPRFGTLGLLAFPKTKITFEREEISNCQWDSGKYNGATNGDWENCVRSQDAYFEGDWGIIVLRTMFLVSYIFLNKMSLFFIVSGWILSGQASYTWQSKNTNLSKPWSLPSKGWEKMEWTDLWLPICCADFWCDHVQRDMFLHL